MRILLWNNLYLYNIDTVKTMYESCRYEKSWQINSHPAWCAVFSQKDLEVKSPMKLFNKYLPH